MAHLDGFIGAHDDGDAYTEHHVSEETDEAIEVDSTVPPDVAVRQCHLKRDKHVVPIEK